MESPPCGPICVSHTSHMCLSYVPYEPLICLVCVTHTGACWQSWCSTLTSTLRPSARRCTFSKTKKTPHVYTPHKLTFENFWQMCAKTAITQFFFLADPRQNGLCSVFFSGRSAPKRPLLSFFFLADPRQNGHYSVPLPQAAHDGQAH